MAERLRCDRKKKKRWRKRERERETLIIELLPCYSASRGQEGAIHAGHGVQLLNQPALALLVLVPMPSLALASLNLLQLMAAQLGSWPPRSFFFLYLHTINASHDAFPSNQLQQLRLLTYSYKVHVYRHRHSVRYLSLACTAPASKPILATRNSFPATPSSESSYHACNLQISITVAQPLQR